MRVPPPSPSNPFARALQDGKPITSPRLRFAFGVTLTLVLAACFTLAVLFLGALLMRGVAHGDFRALGVGLAVIALSVAMARGRRGTTKQPLVTR